MANCHSIFSGACCSSKEKKNFFGDLINKKNKDNYLLIGTPNVGKSTYFNKITWQNSPVGNIDRITVMAKNGCLRGDSNVNIIDLPGVYSLTPTTKDEEIVIKSILNQNYVGCMNIVGATSFNRDMLLTIQLLEAGIVKDICINMIDELKNYTIVPFKLSRKLGVRVHLISATKNNGVKQSVNSLLTPQKENQLFQLKYSDMIENLISQIVEFLPNVKNVTKRFVAIQYLQGNCYIHNILSSWNIKNNIDKILSDNQINLNQTSLEIKKIRIAFVQKLFNFVFLENKQQSKTFKNKKSNCLKFDKLLLNPWFGIPFFLLILFAIYYLTFGAYAGGFIADQLALGFEKLQEIISNAMPSISNTDQWLQMFVADGLLGGIFTVLGFLPYIIIMFGLIYIIEQTGYLARVSLLFDNQLSKFGISGRSIITLIAGTGCNIPSIIMARNSHSFKERTILVLISPFVSCSARLVVFMWIAEQFIINTSFIWLFGLGFTLISCIITLFMGLVFSKTLFRESKTFLLTEISKWRLPSFMSTFKKIIFESWDFIKRVVTVVFIVNIVVFLLNYISPTLGLVIDPNAINIDYKNATFLQYISLVFQYLFYPIGLGDDYRLASSLIAAAPAKEIAASVLDTTFNTNNSSFYDAFFGANSNISLPIATIGSYIFMFAFYTPCVAAMVVLKKEGGWKNLIIHLISAFVLSYILCIFVYAGIGSVELIAYNHNLISNPLIIICWTIIAIALIGLFVNNIFWYTSYIKNITITFNKYKILYNINWIFSGFILFGTLFGLVYCFIYS